MTLDQLKRTPRVVGVSGGPEKVEALRGALAGGLINVLITDSATAVRLLEAPSDGMATAAPRPTARREAAAP
jgi:DNA-binding transcriptional regulator LsrR (DeoR family)